MSNMKMTPEDLKNFMKDQCLEIEKYKWNLGIKLSHDPLIDRSYNDICAEWISNFSIQYRQEWEGKHINK